jgi:hypothetical protein
MTDLDISDNATKFNAVPEDESKYLIEVELKNKAGTIVIDLRKVKSDDQYREALRLGFKAMAERAMSKITKAEYPDEDERKAAILAKATQNIQDVYDGTAKIPGKAAVKVSGKGSAKVMTEAMRLAREMVKDAMKLAKIKITHVKASEVTAAAKALIADDPSIVATAEANLKARESAPLKLNIASLIKVDPALAAKDAAKQAARQAEKDTQLSKTQAGKVAPRAKGSKPKPQPQASA